MLIKNNIIFTYHFIQPEKNNKIYHIHSSSNKCVISEINKRKTVLDQTLHYTIIFNIKHYTKLIVHYYSQYQTLY